MAYIYARKIETGKMTLKEFKAKKLPSSLVEEVLEILEKHGFVEKK